MGAIWSVNKISAGVSATITAINAIKAAYIGLRTVLITTGIAEAFATAGVSVGSASVALAAVGGIAALVYGTKKIPGLAQSVIGDRYGISVPGAARTGGVAAADAAASLAYSKPTPGSGAVPGSLSGGGVTKILATSKVKKTSIKSMEKLTVGGSSSSASLPSINVFVDGSKSSAKVATQNQPLKRP
jgi:hypothetical protein